MTALAVICEYNPFHTGHAYHINAAKEITGADCVLGIMSGCFVQRAEPGIVSPSVRATAAIESGMDFVIELPTVFSCSAGSVFAYGAVKILSRMDFIKYLAMGTEDDGKILLEIADVQSNQNVKFTEILKKRLSEGFTYANAITAATQNCMPHIRDCAEILGKPNNILAIEYIKALKKSGAKIEPIFIKRKGNGYNDISSAGEFISASAARKLLYQKRYNELRPYIPEYSFDKLVSEFENHPIDLNVYNALTVHALRNCDISQSFDAAEGLDAKLKENAMKFSNLNTVAENSKCKRYTMSRIRRVCLQTLLGISKDTMKYSDNAAGRLIAIKNTRKNSIKNLTGVAVKNTDYVRFENDADISAEIDGLAGSIYSLITHRDGNIFWDRKLISL